MPVLFTVFNTRDLYSRCVAHIQSNWQWRDLFQSVRSRKNHKKGLEDIYGQLVDFRDKFQICPISTISASFRSSWLIGSSGLIITAHTRPYLFCPPSSCTYMLTVTYDKRKFSCVLYAHSKFLCSLASFKLSSLGVHHPSRIPSLLNGYSTRHSRRLTALQMWTALK